MNPESSDNSTPSSSAPSPQLQPNPPVVESFASRANAVQGKPKPSRKKLFAIIAAAVVIVIAGGSYAAYALWYNNSGKVTDDALRSVLMAKSASYTGRVELAPAKGTGQSATIIDFDGQGDQDNSQVNLKVDVNMAPLSLKVGSSFISTKSGDLYFKIDNAKGILDTFAGFMGTNVDSNPALKSINDKMDNKWVKMTAADVKELNSSGDDQQTVCLQKAITDFQNSKSQQDQLFKAFNDNRFVSVDKQLGSAKIGDSTSNGYQLGFDKAKATSFGKATEQIDVTKAIQKCLGDSSPTDDELTKDVSSDNTKVEIWADQWSHELTRLKITVDNHESGVMTFNFDPQLNKPANVSVPTTNLTQFKDLKKDFESLFPADSFMPTSDFSSELQSLEN